MAQSSTRQPTARPSARQPSFVRSIGRAISWHRRKLAVVAAIAAVLTGVNAASPSPPPTTSVVTASSALAGGTRLTAEALTVTEFPDDVVPGQAITDPADLIGLTLAGPVTAGQVLTSVSAVSSRLATDSEMVVAPLRVDDPELIGLLQIGDRLDVLAAESQGGTAHVIADRVRVVTIPRTAGSSGIGGTTSEGPGSLLLVEVTPEDAALLAQAVVSAQISIVLH